MAERQIYVVLTREKGLFLVEPVEGLSQREIVEQAIGMKGGYSVGKVFVDLPAETEAAWAAWVEGEGPNGAPYFMMRAFDGSLTEEQVLERLDESKETPLKLNRTPVYRVNGELSDG